MQRGDETPATRGARRSRERGRLVGAALLGAVCSALAPPAEAGHTQVQVIEARDLGRLAEKARDARLPILLVVSQAWCPYCEQLEHEILAPMLISGEYGDRVIIRELMTDASAPIRDFDGQMVEAAEVAARYHAWLTPTLLFLDDLGREIAPRIRGINTPELYGHYVDAAIEEARARLRGHD